MSQHIPANLVTDIQNVINSEGEPPERYRANPRNIVYEYELRLKRYGLHGRGRPQGWSNLEFQRARELLDDAEANELMNEPRTDLITQSRIWNIDDPPRTKLRGSLVAGTQGPVEWTLKGEISSHTSQLFSFRFTKSYEWENVNPQEHTDLALITRRNREGDLIRTKTRWSYYPGSNFFNGRLQGWRLDLTAVEEYNARSKRNFSDYEFEIEYIGDVAPSPDAKDVIRAAFSGLSMWQNSPYLMSAYTRENVRKAFNSLFFPLFVQLEIDSAVAGKSGVISQSQLTKAQRDAQFKFDRQSGNNLYFGINKPVILKLSDIPNLEQFAPTVKADGSRRLIFFHSTGSEPYIFELFPPFSIRNIKIDGVSASTITELAGTLIDGELISDIGVTGGSESPTSVKSLFRAEYGRDKSGRSNYKMFDILFASAGLINRVREVNPNKHIAPPTSDVTDVRYLPLYDHKQTNIGRIDILKTVKGLIPSLGLKKYYTPVSSTSETGDVVTTTIWERTSKAISDHNNVEVLWRRSKGSKGMPVDGIIFQPLATPYQFAKVVKWKPLSKLSIDFSISIADIPSEDKGVAYIEVYTIEQGRLHRFRGDNEHALSTVGPQHEPVVIVNTTEIDELRLVNKQIVEFGWDIKKLQLYPMRVRTDRDKPNKQQVALETWRSIHSPITSQSLTGNNLTAMRTFHNQTKLSLLERVFSSGRYSTLLDVGPGRGGDLSKWLKVGFYTVYAVEPDRNNLAIMAKRKEDMGLPAPKIIAVRGAETEVELGGLRLAEETRRRYYILPRAYANIPVPTAVLLKYFRSTTIPQEYQTKRGDVTLDTFIRIFFMDKRYTKPYYRGDDLVYLIDPTKEVELSSFNGTIMTTTIKDPMRHIILINSKLEDVESLPFYSFNPSQALQEGRVDVVTAFFSFTFMFESQETLRKALTNIHKLLRPGGRFIGIVLSGERVSAALEHKKKLGSKTVGWSIKPSPGYDQNVSLEENPWNRLITIDLSDKSSMVKKLEEPLASINVLTQEAERVGLEKSEHLYPYYDYYTGESEPEKIAMAQKSSLVTQTTLTRKLAREALGLYATESEVSSLASAIDPQFYLLQRNGLPANDLSSLYRTFSYIKRPIQGPSDMQAAADSKAEELYRILASPKETYTTQEIQDLSDELRSLQLELSKYYILSADPTLQQINDEMSEISLKMQRVQRAISWGLPGITSSAGLIRRELGIEHLPQDRQQAIATLTLKINDAKKVVEGTFAIMAAERGDEQAQVTVAEARIQLNAAQKTIKDFMRDKARIEDKIKKTSTELTAVAAQLHSLQGTSAFRFYFAEKMDEYMSEAKRDDESLTGINLFIAGRERAQSSFDKLSSKQKVRYQEMADEEGAKLGKRVSRYIRAIYPSIAYAGIETPLVFPLELPSQSDVVKRVKKLSKTVPEAFTADNITSRIGALDAAIATEKDETIKRVAIQYRDHLARLLEEDTTLTKIQDAMERKKKRLKEKWKTLKMESGVINEVLGEDLLRFRDTTHFIVTASALVGLYSAYETLDEKMRKLKLRRYTYIRDRVLDADTAKRLIEMKTRARELEKSKKGATMVSYLRSQIETLTSAMRDPEVSLTPEEQAALAKYLELEETLKQTTDAAERQNLIRRMEELYSLYLVRYDQSTKIYNKLYQQYEMVNARLHSISDAEFSDSQAVALYEARAQILRLERQMEVYATGLGVAVSKVDWVRAGFAIRYNVVKQLIEWLPKDSAALKPLSELLSLIERYRRLIVESMKTQDIKGINASQRNILDAHYRDLSRTLASKISQMTVDIENIVTRELTKHALPKYRELVQKDHPDYTPNQINSEAKRVISQTVTFSVETVRDPTNGDLIVENTGTHKFRVRLPLERNATSYYSEVLDKSERIVAAAHSLPERKPKRVELPPEDPPLAPDASTTKKSRESKITRAQNVAKAQIVTSEADDETSSAETQETAKLESLNTNENELKENPAAYTQTDVHGKIDALKQDKASLKSQIRILGKSGEEGLRLQVKGLIKRRKEVQAEILKWEQYTPLPPPPISEPPIPPISEREVPQRFTQSEVNDKIATIRRRIDEMVTSQTNLSNKVKAIQKKRGTNVAKKSREYIDFISARDRTKELKEELNRWLDYKPLQRLEAVESEPESGEEEGEEELSTSESEHEEEIEASRNILCLYDETNNIQEIHIETVYTPGDGNCMAYAVLISKDPTMMNYTTIPQIKEEKDANPLYQKMKELRMGMLKLMKGDWAEGTSYNKKYTEVFASVAGKRRKAKKESRKDWILRGYDSVRKIVIRSGCWLNTDMLEVVADVLKANIIVIGEIPEGTATEITEGCLYPVRRTTISDYTNVIVIYNDVSTREKARGGERGGHFEAVRIRSLEGGLITSDMAEQDPDIDNVYQLLRRAIHD